ELHVTNIYGDTGPLKPQQLDVYADDDRTPLARFDAEDLAAMTRPAPAGHAPVRIDAGKRVVAHVWLTLLAGRPVPRTLRHRMSFAAMKQRTELLDGVRVPVSADAP